MRLQHYLGGLENLGPVNFFDKKVFMAEWEKRIFGIHTVMMAESTHLD
ncbi:MAG: nitrile hydratase subunit beta, partial [Nitrospiraceae bacterium]